MELYMMVIMGAELLYFAFDRDISLYGIWNIFSLSTELPVIKFNMDVLIFWHVEHVGFSLSGSCLLRVNSSHPEAVNCMGLWDKVKPLMPEFMDHFLPIILRRRLLRRGRMYFLRDLVNLCASTTWRLEIANLVHCAGSIILEKGLVLFLTVCWVHWAFRCVQ